MNDCDGQIGDGLSEDAFTEQVVSVMPRMMLGILQRERNDLATGVLTIPQLSVLHCLQGTVRNTMHGIAVQLNLKPSSLTGIMDRLVAMGMVWRFNSEDDRRVVMAEMTDKGRAVLDRILDEKKVTIKRLYSYLTPEERIVHIHVITKVLQAMEADVGPPAAETES